MALTRRVEVLFDPVQYEDLERIARSRRETVGALVRKAVEEQWLRLSPSQRREAVRGLLSEESDVTWDEAKRILETDVGRRF